MRGVALIVAVTVVAEVGDFSRFAKPRQLMAYLGLVPSERSSGSTVRRGGITKAGNALARRVLIEGAWTYRMPARVSRKLHDRLEPLPSADPRHRLEGADAAVRALSASGRRRQGQGGRHHRDRPRDGRLHLGDRPPGPASAGKLTGEPHLDAHERAAGPVGEPSCPVMSRREPTLALRARQPRDAATVMR